MSTTGRLQSASSEFLLADVENGIRLVQEWSMDSPYGVFTAGRSAI
jgi:hypothetical protein